MSDIDTAFVTNPSSSLFKAIKGLFTQSKLTIKEALPAVTHALYAINTKQT